jgi:hypothetical protein
VARVLFVALLTVASYVIAFGGVGSAALDSAVAYFVLPVGAAPLLLGAALRSGVIAWPAGSQRRPLIALGNEPYARLRRPVRGHTPRHTSPGRRP